MVNFIDLKNSITLTSSKIITNISKPLFNYSEITYFDFLRVYKDQGHICLTTSPDWNKYYYENGFYIGKKHEYFNKEDISSCIIEDLVITNTTIDIERQKVRKKFQHGHSFRIERVNEDYKDSYTFGTRLGNYDINRYYLYNIDALNSFIDYFIICSTPIIIQAEKEKFCFPQIERDLQKLSCMKKKESFFPKEFYQQIKLKKMPLTVDDRVVYLSEKEIECLTGFIQGKSAKSIAKYKNISYRTVEAHLHNIKQKLGCWTKEEVIEKIFSNIFLRNYFFKRFNNL